MNKPEKIKCENCAMYNKGKRGGESIACVNYNEAIEEYDKFLPSEEEITKLFKATMDNESSRNNGSKALNIHPYSNICSCGRCHTAYLLSKAIRERLVGGI